MDVQAAHASTSSARTALFPKVCLVYYGLLSKCRGDKISQVTFKTFGCGAAITASSILTEKIKGLPMDETLERSDRIIEEIFLQLPEKKEPCLKMAANALKLAIEENGSGLAQRMCWKKGEDRRGIAHFYWL